MIRSVKIEDAKFLTAIYNHYIVNTCTTFEETALLEEDFKKRIQKHNPKLPWLVFETNDRVIGYAYATDWKLRSAYKFTVESSIYLDVNSLQKGIGTQLYQSLIDQLITLKMHAVIGGIALPNPNSIKFHEKMGFKQIAHFKEVGFKFNRWVDVGYWELLLS